MLSDTETTKLKDLTLGKTSEKDMTKNRKEELKSGYISVIYEAGKRMINTIPHEDWRNDMDAIYKDFVDYFCEKEGCELKSVISSANVKLSRPL